MLHSFQKIATCLVGCLISSALFAQSTTESIRLTWDASLRSSSTPAASETPIYYAHFEGAVYDEASLTLPFWVKKIPLSQYSTLTVELANAQFEPLLVAPTLTAGIGEDIIPQAEVVTLKGQMQGLIRLMPIRKNSSTQQYEKLVSAQLRIVATPAQLPHHHYGRTNTTISALNDGTIYKIAVNQTGVHKIDYNFLKNMGVDVDNIDPRNIQLLGNGGAALPELLAVSRVDDLAENAIWVQGESDGRFNSQDFILFYAQGTATWSYDTTQRFYYHLQNPYTTQNYYFIKIANTNGKRIQTQADIASTAYTSSSYDGLAHYENDEYNLMEIEHPSLPPSGRKWLGDAFQTQRSKTFNFSFNNRRTTDAVKIHAEAVARAFNTSSFSYVQNGSTIANVNVAAIGADIYGTYARVGAIHSQFTSPSNAVDVQVNFNNGSSTAQGWLDFITLNARCNLVFANGQMNFRDQATRSQTSATFQLSNANNVTIWDVTDLDDVAQQATSGSGNISFGFNTQQVLREFVAFDGTSFLTPTAVGNIPNQNLHGMTTPPAMVIVYHPNFQAAAQQLAQHRASHNNITVQLVDVFQIFNEFGSGKPDVTAIRDFAKMLYDRTTSTDSLRYLLLFGAGSFDYRNISISAADNSNFVPLYETIESLEPTATYTSDDYFALLDNNEGNIIANDQLDISVGRLPFLSADEASAIVQKIIRYDTDPKTLGDWRNVITFIADDQDNNLHVNDADGFATTIANTDTIYNIDKIYCDAYPQVSTGGGSRYPAVNEAILHDIFKGSLVIAYVGHGGDDGLAQERIFTTAEINTLKNEYKLPLFITATCDFSPHDDPSITSAGELLVLNPEGGAMGLFTTVRVVYADANEALVRSTFNNMFVPVNGKMPTLGEILQNAKNTSGLTGSANSRKYVLLGDPAMRLAYPQYNVVTTQINSQAPQFAQDTFRALQLVTISGEVRDLSNNLANSFNGFIYPTVFDKVDTLRTRGNDANSQVRPFNLQKKVIFKGKASVTNGHFTFSFMVPKDINYTMGFGRISYYADNTQELDAAGMYRGVIIGGTNPNPSQDNQGPEVKVYMNDDKFAFGGITDNNPVLLVKLYDENGINTVGNSIGHDLTGELEFPTSTQKATATTQSYVLNDFYESETNNYQRGTVQYPLKDLKDGKHIVNVEAWDVYNNKGIGNTEFIVSSASELALSHVLNYPNPFTTHTSFQFEHNLPNQTLDVQVQVFTVAGRLLKTIQQTIISEGYRVTDIAWDGLDDYGDRIGRGVYIYKVSVRTHEGTTLQAKEYQKLVILR